MEPSNVEKILAIGILCLLVPFFIIPIKTDLVYQKKVIATTQDGKWDPHGPYVDSVIFYSILGRHDQVSDLRTGRIDHVAEPIDDRAIIQELESDPDVDVTQSDSLGFDCIVINCERYPYSIPAFRRALALAVDKHEVASILWGNLGVVLDTPLPPSCGVWHNNDTTPNFWESNITGAQAELAAAGFIDLNGDGYVEAPNGDSFIFQPMYHHIGTNWGDVFDFALTLWTQAGIQVEPDPVYYGIALDEYVYTYPRNYDGVCLHITLDEPLPMYLEKWIFEEIMNQYGNIANWGNNTYDAYVDAMLNSSDYQEVLQAVHAAQQVFVENVPLLIFCSNYYFHAHRNDRFEGWVGSLGYGTGPRNHWTPRKVRLLEWQSDRNPFTGTGGIFKTAIDYLLSSQNPLMTDSDRDVFILSQIYTSLTGDVDPRDNSAIAQGGGLAYNWTKTDLGDTLQFNFTLVTNATWHDGFNVTAEDVEFSYNYIANNQPSTYAAKIPYFNSCTIIDDAHIQIITNNRSYWAFDNIRDWVILPKHVWEGIINPATFTNEIPIGCGPFKWYSYDEGNKVRLSYWEEYHYGIPRLATIDITSIFITVILVVVIVIAIVLFALIIYLKTSTKTRSKQS